MWFSSLFSPAKRNVHQSGGQSESGGDLDTSAPIPFVSDYRSFPSKNLDPSTLSDLEVTADSAEALFGDVELLQRDGRLLLAAELLEKLQTYASTAPLTSQKSKLRARLEEDKGLERLRISAAECRQALSEAEEPADRAGWDLIATQAGFRTYVKRVSVREAWRSVQLRIEGSLEGASLFDQWVVAREVTFYKQWAPACRASRVVKPSNLSHVEIQLPFFLRDCVMRSYACDCTERDTLIICSQSEDDDAKAPASPRGWMAGRLRVRRLTCCVKIRGLDRGDLCMTVVFEPNGLFNPVLVPVMAREVVSLVIPQLQSTARKIQPDDKADELGVELNRCIREDPFYAQVLLPRLLWYCERKGWPWPGHHALPSPAPPNADSLPATRDDDAFELLESDEVLTPSKPKRLSAVEGMRGVMGRKGEAEVKMSVQAGGADPVAQEQVGPSHEQQEKEAQQRVLMRQARAAALAARQQQQGQAGSSPQTDDVVRSPAVIIFTYFALRLALLPIVRRLLGPWGELAFMAFLNHRSTLALIVAGDVKPPLFPTVLKQLDDLCRMARWPRMTHWVTLLSCVCGSLWVWRVRDVRWPILDDGPLRISMASFGVRVICAVFMVLVTLLALFDSRFGASSYRMREASHRHDKRE